MRIALIGSAPSSIRLAPYGNPDWQIWGCSPGAYGVAGPHAHAWFEIHRWEPQVAGHAGTGQPWFSPEYVEFLTRFKGDLWFSPNAYGVEMQMPPELGHAKPIPVMDLVGEFGPFFFTSSLAWMFALALREIEKAGPGDHEIGLWGVDMSAHEEYGFQRSGCQYFITLAAQRGIHVTIPPESDLLQPSYWYGVSENHPMMIKLTARRRELEARKAQSDQQAAVAREQSMFLAGALDDIDYMIKTWVTHQAWIEPTMGKTGNEVRAGKPLSEQGPEDIVFGPMKVMRD